jgi:hypothetical protein
MSEIFISYAREDREKAQILAQLLQDQHWNVWWDKVIPPGMKYGDVIGAELSSAKAVIVLWSRSSVASDWVKDEAQEGANRQVLVPALIDKVSPPYGFRQVQTADLSDWDGSASHAELQSMVHRIGELINKPVNESVLANAEPQPNRTRLMVYAGMGAVLVLLLAFVGYKLMNRTTDNKQHNGPGSNSVNNTASTTCSSDSQSKAVDSTSKGLVDIDPNGNFEAARLRFKEAKRECPTFPDAYFWSATASIALQDSKQAIADFRTFLELASRDDSNRPKAEKFLADLTSPPPTPTQAPTHTPAQNANTVAANTGSTNSGPVNVNNATPRPTIVPTAQVNEMFAADKSTRIAATTRFIIEKKHDPHAVKASVKNALEHLDNKSGVINTLVYLESVDPAVLKQNKAEIQKLLEAAKPNGDQTIPHINKVQALLNN